MGRGNVIHVLGLEFDEEHNGEVRFQISIYLEVTSIYKFHFVGGHIGFKGVCDTCL
jgi:hypothetical protein